MWRDVLVWVTSPKLVLEANQPLPLVLAPAPDVYRKRALAGLHADRRAWRIAYTSPSSEGLQAAVRAGLGVTVMSKDMVPEGLMLVGAEHDMPQMPDAEIALYRAPGTLSPAAQPGMLSEHIIHSLELTPTQARSGDL